MLSYSTAQINYFNYSQAYQIGFAFIGQRAQATWLLYLWWIWVGNGLYPRGSWKKKQPILLLNMFLGFLVFTLLCESHIKHEGFC